MIDTQAIRKKILDLALRGKLTEQLPEDGTAEELFQQIQQKKHSKLVKEKAKSEKPFEIPENWKWVHLNEIADTSLGKTLDKSKNTGDLCPYLCSINVHWDGIKLDTVKKARFTEEEKTKYELAPGDLLICEGGDVGRTAIWNQNTVMYYQNALHRVRFYCDINPWFYRDLFEYYKAVGLLDWFSTGMAIKHLVQSSLYSLWLPLPPLSEQKRIVDKVDSMITILDTINTLQSQYQDNLATLKNKIIDAAIQGKLTEHLPDDGTAEELYQQIQQEKAALEKAGQIKKSKPLPPISAEEKPFIIPENWMWVRWGVLSEQIQYGYIASAKKSGNIKMVRISDIQDNKVDWVNVPYCDIDDKNTESYLLHNNDVLFARTGGTVGKSYLVENITEKAVFAGYLIRSSYSDKLNAKYIKLFMDSSLYWKQLQNGTTATAQPNCNGQTLSKMILPLPPLAEQKRIVAKLEELLPLCEE